MFTLYITPVIYLSMNRFPHRHVRKHSLAAIMTDPAPAK